MTKQTKSKVALVTGAAGFIGYHISKRLLDEGWRVIGLDCMSDYYDVSLKEYREGMLLKYSQYRSVHEKVEKPNVLMKLFEEEEPMVVVHLAAQAGVRYSIDNPRAYLKSNVLGTFELLEAARAFPPRHILLASTSSVYGANTKMPYCETDKADHQISFYAATKKSTESMAHSYAHLFNIPITMFRFFTVYGPWGRPDMAIFKFTKSILSGEKIDIYNHGEMKRDFTYIDDLIEGIIQLIHKAPLSNNEIQENLIENDSKSDVAPYRIVNIGNSRTEKLNDFITLLERSLGIIAKKNYLPMQAGDVPDTWANSDLLKEITGFQPKTNICTGIPKFVEWYCDFYNEAP
jgi:UDP-glucuronate 4-epimerase